MVNTTLARGHHAQTRCTARNFLMFHTVSVRPNKNCTLLFLTGEDDIARFDSRHYKRHLAFCPLCLHSYQAFIYNYVMTTCLDLLRLKIKDVRENVKNHQQFFSHFLSFQTQRNLNWCDSPLKESCCNWNISICTLVLKGISNFYALAPPPPLPLAHYGTVQYTTIKRQKK